MNAHERAASLGAIELDFPLSERERRELDGHIATCPPCRNIAERLRVDANSLRAIAAVPPAPRVRAAFASAVVRPETVTSRVLVDLRPYIRLALVAALVAALTIGLLAVGMVGSRGKLLGLQSTIDAPASLAPNPSRPGDVQQAVVRREFAACSNATALVPATDSVLLICAGEVERLQLGGPTPGSTEVLTPYPSELVGGLADVAATTDSIWGVGTDALVRLTRSTGLETMRVPSAGGDAVAADDRAVWVVSTTAGRVTRVDPATGRIVATVHVGQNPEGIVLAGGRVWVSNRGSNSVSEIDPATNTVAATITVGFGPLGLASAGGAIWVADDAAGEVSRIDPATAAADVVPIAPQTDTSFLPAIAAQGDRSVWVADTHELRLVEIDVASEKVVLRLAVPGITPATNGISDLATGDDGAIWVSDVAGSLREVSAP
jgi:YVTN family beta-propeller protein